MGIFDIPNELLLLIGEWFSIKDLFHFLLTCRRLSSLLIRRLHKLGVQDVDGMTALQWAAGHGHTLLVKLSISSGAEIDKPSRWMRNRTALHSAASQNHVAVIDILAKHGASISIKDSCWRTPLHLAALFGHVEATTTLLKLGADMTCTDKNMETPAHTAAHEGRIGCLKAFVDAGFDFNTRGPEHRTLLHYAAYGTVEMAEYLLRQREAKVIINVQDSFGETPLHSVMGIDPTGEKMKLLLRHGADAGVMDYHGDTPVQKAVRLGNVEAARACVKAGCDVRIRGFMDRTILHDAAQVGKEMVEYLLREGGGRAIINAKDSVGSTPLHLVACSGVDVAETVGVLVRYGADTGVEDSEGFTPAHRAAFVGDVNCLRAFIIAGFDVSIRGPSGRTILHDAVEGGLHVMKYLLREGGGRNIINAQDSRGITPLHLAAECGSAFSGVEKVNLLTRYGADPVIKNCWGETPADVAAYGEISNAWSC